MKNKAGGEAAIYARVSSEQQAEAGTIASQIEALTQRVEADGASVVPELCFIDEGYSGATLVRPALERMRDLAAAGAIDRIYVLCPDRLARKYAYQVLLIDEFHRSGVELTFLNHKIGKTPEEDLLLQVQGMVAEYERAKILERVRRGKLHAARRGSVNVLSGAPYGYKYVGSQEQNGEAYYEIVLDEAKVVKRVFQWIGRDKCSIRDVCRRLHSWGIKTRTGKEHWDPTTIWGMLQNPAYKGMAAYGKTRIGPRRPSVRPQKGVSEQPRKNYSTYVVPDDERIHIPVPAIVSEDLFATVGRQLEENRKRRRQRLVGAQHLLQGLLVCKKCGYAYYGKRLSKSASKGRKRKYAYYRCIGTDAHRFGGQRLCTNRQVRTDLLEESVWEDVRSLLSDPKRIEQEYARRIKAQSNEANWESSGQLHAGIKKVKRGMARLVDAYEEGLLEKDEFEPRMRKSKDRLHKLKEEAKTQAEQESERDALQTIIGRMEEFAATVKSGLEQADWKSCREIICAVVKRIEVDEEEVTIVYRVAPDPFVEAPKRGRMQHCLRGTFADPGERVPARGAGSMV